MQSHRHVLVDGDDPAWAPLVLLHGSGGDEQELVPLARKVASGATLLGIRGTVPFEGGSAFFHRLADRTIDEDDVCRRCPVLAHFIESLAPARPPIALAFSNGAIMAAAALLLMRPELLSAAALLRPLSPFTRDLPTRLPGTPVLIIDGANDRRRSPGDGERLADRLMRAGAVVTHHVLPVGHAITVLDEAILCDWLGKLQHRRQP